MSATTKPVTGNSNRWARVDWPGYILFLLLIGGLVYYYLDNPFATQTASAPEAAVAAAASAPEPAQAEPVVAEAAPAEAPAPETTVAAVDATPPVSQPSTGLSGFLSRLLPSGTNLEFAEGGIESQLITFIEDDAAVIDKKTWFDFDRLNFKTGSSELTDDSMAQVANIHEILKAYPAVNLKIGGYTDNTGAADANQRISEARAKAVMAALVLRGVDAARLEAEGYGDQHPIASNDTPEGRAKNRRIAVSVRAK